MFANTFSAGPAHALVTRMRSLFCIALGDESGGAHHLGRLLLAWNVVFDMKKDKGFVRICFSFLTEVGVYVRVCACICTHKHTLHVGYPDVSPGFGTRILKGQKNPNGLNLGTYAFVYVYIVHMYIHMLGSETRS